MKNLFKIETYKGANLSRPDTNTIVAERIRDRPFVRIVFKRVVEMWEVKVRVTGYFTDEPEPNHVNLYGSTATDEIKEFWVELDSQAFDQDRFNMEDRRRRLVEIVDDAQEGTPKSHHMPKQKHPSSKD